MARSRGREVVGFSAFTGFDLSATKEGAFSRFARNSFSAFTGFDLSATDTVTIPVGAVTFDGITGSLTCDQYGDCAERTQSPSQWGR